MSRMNNVRMTMEKGFEIFRKYGGGTCSGGERRYLLPCTSSPDAPVQAMNGNNGLRDNKRNLPAQVSIQILCSFPVSPIVGGCVPTGCETIVNTHPGF